MTRRAVVRRRSRAPPLTWTNYPLKWAASLAAALPLTRREAERELELIAENGDTLRLDETLYAPDAEPMAIERSTRRVAAKRIAATARELLDASTLCAIASVTRSGGAYINAAYFAWSPDFDIVWLSEPRATHSRNLGAKGSVAIAVYDSSQTWGEPDRGIQLFGAAHETRGKEAEDTQTLYAKRFPRFADTDLSAYRFYRFRPGRLKLFDERTLGRATFVTARVGRGNQLEWLQTEIYRSSA